MTRRYIVGWLTLAAMIVAGGQVLALETMPGEPKLEGEADAAGKRAVPSDEPLAAGRVVAVDAATGRITLEFRPIPELLPEGGTRVFSVKEPAWLEGLRPGDKLRFEVERDGRNYIITRIANSN
jgi:Cu(I)/Ag(I) efflux system protein CusF